MSIRWKNGVKTKTALRYHLGKESRHTVYEGEVIGKFLGLHLLLKGTTGLGRTSSFVDNQASILATKSTKPAPGHYLVDLFHAKYLQAKKKHKHMNLTVKWIPSHEEVEGNEEADRQAKLAAQGNSSPDALLPAQLRKTLPYSKSAVLMTKTKQIKQQAAAVLRASKQWNHIRTIDPTLPSKRFKKIVDKLSRTQATLYIQLRTGHAPLNKHLYNIKCADTPLCIACNNAHETIHHYLLTCPAYELARTTLTYTLGREARSLQALLSHLKAVKPLFKYIVRTGRFRVLFGDSL